MSTHSGIISAQVVRIPTFVTQLSILVSLLKRSDLSSAGECSCQRADQHEMVKNTFEDVNKSELKAFKKNNN